jgi:hypothetical protein
MLHFEKHMQNTHGIGLLKPDPRITRIAPYGYVIKYFSEKLKDIPRCVAFRGCALRRSFLRARLQEFAFSREFDGFPRLKLGSREASRFAYHVLLPSVRSAAYHEAVWFPHQNFLGSKEDADAIVNAIHKVLENLEELRGFDHKAIRNQKLGRADRES